MVTFIWTGNICPGDIFSTSINTEITDLICQKIEINLKVGFDMKMTLVHHELNVSNISAVSDPIWTKLKSCLFGTICNRFQVSRWHLSMQHFSRGHICPYQSAISQLLLNQFWSNIEGRFLGPSLPDAICQGNVFPDNIFLVILPSSAQAPASQSPAGGMR